MIFIFVYEMIVGLFFKLKVMENCNRRFFIVIYRWFSSFFRYMVKFQFIVFVEILCVCVVNIWVIYGVEIDGFRWICLIFFFLFLKGGRFNVEVVSLKRWQSYLVGMILGFDRSQRFGDFYWILKSLQWKENYQLMVFRFLCYFFIIVKCFIIIYNGKIYFK